MSTSRHRATRLRGLRRDPAFIKAVAPASNAWRRLSVPADRGRTALGQLRQGLTTIGVGVGSVRSPAAWRPLIRFWLVLLGAGAGAGAVLEYLGPPAGRSAQALAGGSGEAVEFRPPTAMPPGPAAGEQASLKASTGDVSRPDAPPTPPDPASATARRLTVFYAAESRTAAAAVQQLTAQVGLTADEVAAEPADISSPRAGIRFYSPDDHPLARRIGRELGRMGYPWQIENLSARAAPPEQKGLEVWLPYR